MQKSSAFHNWKISHPIVWALIKVLAATAGFVVLAILGAAVLFFSRTTAGTAAMTFTAWLLAGNPPNATWYITRASGLVAFLLLWLSTLWGLGISTRILGKKLHGSFTYDFHQVISLLALGFMGIHIIILLFDKFTPFTLTQILVPFVSDYRPVWVGLGIISLYISLLVTVTFYMRGRIGSKAFRLIHTLSLAGFLGAAMHGLFSGTDSGLAAMQMVYAASIFSVVFLLTYWIAAGILQRRQARLARVRTTQGREPSRLAAD